MADTDDRLVIELLLSIQKTLSTLRQGAKAAGDFDKAMENAQQAVAKLGDDGGKRIEQFAKVFGTASAFAKDFRTQVEQAKEAIRQMTEQGIGMKDAFAGLSRFSQLTGVFSPQAISQARQELKNFDDTIKETSTSMDVLDKISVIFFGTTLGNLAIGVLRRLSNQLKELSERGVQVARTYFNFGVSIRALQRIGLDITFAEVEDQVQRLSETFSFFTERQIREGVSQIFLLTRNLKLSKEEMFDLTEATAALAIITGKDFAEEGLLVARAIASGYTEALQRAGIEASRFTIQQEAAKLGIDKSFNAMTQAERAAVTLGLVLDQMGNISEDVGKFQETAAGRIAEATASIEEQKDIIGEALIPIYGGLLMLLEKVATFSAKAFVDLRNDLLRAVGIMVESIIVINKMLAKELEIETIGEFFDVVFERVEKGLETIEDQIKASDFGDVEFDPRFAEDIGNELNEEAQKLKDEVEDIIDRYRTGLLEASLDIIRRNEDIDIRFERRTADEETDFLQDIEKLNRATQDKIVDSQVKFREKELKAEKDFQEKLQKLREKALFDLEDALRERDAKQVLRLIRRFNLEKSQLDREEKQDKQSREKAYKDELSDINKQKERKFRELQIEHEQRNAELALQRDREREDALRSYYREIEDLKRHMLDRLNTLKEGLSEELQIYVNYLSGILSLAQIGAVRMAEIMRFLYGSTIGSGIPGFGGGGSKKLAFAEGGTLIARKPTLAVFGEVPEVVNFSPIGRIGRNEGRVFGGSLSPNGSRRDRLEMLISLSRGLEADIIDRTLDHVADIVMETT